MKTITVTLVVGVEVSDDVDLDTADGYSKALDLAAEDVAARGVSEIVDVIVDIGYGGDC